MTVPVRAENQRFVGIQVRGERRQAYLRGTVTNNACDRIGEEETYELDDTSPKAVTLAIGNMIGQLWNRHRGINDVVVAIGIEIGGVVDENLVRNAPALGPDWTDERLADGVLRTIAGVLRPPPLIVVTNDANARAVLELKFPVKGGGLSDQKHFAVVVMAEAGVGCGLILDKRLYTGHRGAAGELGHVKVTNDNVPCHCGRTGCLESLATAAAIRRGTSSEVAGRALGVGLATLINVVSPQAILIYGQESTTGAAQRGFYLGSGTPQGGSPYLTAMLEELEQQMPGEATDRCYISIRAEKDEPGPRAPAAVAIHFYEPDNLRFAK